MQIKKAAEIDRFLKAPPPDVAAVLVYGPDEGKVREYSERAGRSVVEDLSDPFNVANLLAEEVEADPARVADEAASQSLMGGRRLVRVRDARDRTAAVITNAVDGPKTDNLIVVDAGDLKPSGALRKLFDGKRSDLISIACYPDQGRDVAAVIQDAMAAGNVRLDRDALQFLVDRLGADRMATRTEVEKLVLLAGDGGTIDLKTAVDAVGDGAALEIDTLISAAAEGRPVGILPALDRAFAQGESRCALSAWPRVISSGCMASSRTASGQSAAEAVKSLRPPVFWRAVEPMTRQVATWTPEALAEALARLGQSEILCKTTGYPAEAECGAALIDRRISARLQRRRR